MPRIDTMPIKFDQKLCDLNPYCPAARMCPTGALFVDRRTFRPTFSPDKCTECATCTSSCPRGAVFEE